MIENFLKNGELQKFGKLSIKEQYELTKAAEERIRNCPLNDNFEFDEE